jgi:hypothetical protein
MQIVIDNTNFTYDIGCRVLKLKYETAPFSSLEDIWEDIVPITFKEIATEISNIEQRRIAINYLGLERLQKEVEPTLVQEKELEKETMWVNQKGELVMRKFTDVYKLYKVDGTKWGNGVSGWGGRMYDDVFYVKCKDTSTDREYFIWIDPVSVAITNNNGMVNSRRLDIVEIQNHINPIQCIAWTIQTNVKEGDIDYIVRQGDCILIKTKPNYKKGEIRHLTEREYCELLRFES